MSTTTTEEDTELRDLVAATLENTGILGKIKAQLRANVYLALEEGDKVKTKSKLVNQKLVDFLSTTNGRLVASLVREFLEFFDLDFTLAVFDPETNIGKDFKYRERSKLIDALGLTELTDTKSPLLSEIMRLSKVSVLKSESPTPTEVTIEEDDMHTSAHSSLNDDLNSKSEILEKSNNEKSIQSETSHKSDRYSDDFSVSKDRNVSSDSSNNSESTPQINLKEDIKFIKNSNDDKSSDVMFKVENDKSSSRQKNVEADSLKPKDSFLMDLPPLGSKSSLGDLPPLSMPRKGGGLAPLSKIPSKSSSIEIEEKGNVKSSNLLKKTTKQDNNQAKKLSNVPSFGFDPDHVISEKSDDILEKKQIDSSPDITENIEEELDSVLNSGGDDLTRDETIIEDQSLKADYVESL